MEVHAAVVKQLRTDHNWTQQHLADACGLSLRTIQRVERYGNASKDTLMALCAVFEVPHEQLLQQTTITEIVEQTITIDKARERALLLKGSVCGLLAGSLITVLFHQWLIL